MDKYLAFEYYVTKLHDWYNEANPSALENDLSVLKVMKLLFFGIAIDSEKEDSLLDNTFSNFCAMPYGHVESDIYDYVRSQRTFSHIKFESRSSTVKSPISDSSPMYEVSKKKIDVSLKKLRDKNFDLINFSASDLVNLSHEWYSWKYYFNKAKINGSYSESIPITVIKNEQKIFSL